MGEVQSSRLSSSRDTRRLTRKMSFQDAVSELRSYKNKIEDVYTKTLTAGATNSALDERIASAEAGLANLDLEDNFSEDKLSDINRMHRLLEDSMRTNTQALRHLTLSQREKGLKVNAGRERIKREADERSIKCQELRDVVARDQGEVWSRFPMIASMGQTICRRQELAQQVEVAEEHLKTVTRLCHQLEAVKKSNEKKERQLLNDRAKLEQRRAVQEASREEDKEPEESIETAKEAEFEGETMTEEVEEESPAP